MPRHGHPKPDQAHAYPKHSSYNIREDTETDMFVAPTSRNTSASMFLMLAALILLMIPLIDFLRACRITRRQNVPEQEIKTTQPLQAQHG